MSIFFEGIKAGFTGTHGEQETWNYIFRSDNADDRPLDVFRHRRCPKVGDRHPTLNYLWLKTGGLSIRQDSVWSRWTVTVNWTKLENGEDPPQPENPGDPQDIEQPDFNPIVTVHFEEYQKPVNGNDVFSTKEGTEGERITQPVAVVNSALEPYDPPPTSIRMNPILRMQRNVHLNSGYWKDATELLNTVDVKGWEYRRGKFKLEVKPYESRLKFSVGDAKSYRTRTGKLKEYATLTCEAVINRETWRLKLLDAGSYYLKNQPAKSITTRIENNDWVIDPAAEKVAFEADGQPKLGLLDGLGNSLDKSSFKELAYNEYQAYKYVDGDHGKFIKGFTNSSRRRRR